MGVEGTATASAIISAVEEAGYGCSLKGAAGQKESVSDAEKALEDHETPILKKRPHRIRRLSPGTYVLLHGAHDVGLASSRLV